MVRATAGVAAAASEAVSETAAVAESRAVEVMDLSCHSRKTRRIVRTTNMNTTHVFRITGNRLSDGVASCGAGSRKVH
jgi:hypothetical protein